MTGICKANNPKKFLLCFLQCAVTAFQPGTAHCYTLNDLPFEALLAFILLDVSLAFGQATPSSIIDNEYVNPHRSIIRRAQLYHIHPINKCEDIFRMSSVDVNWTSPLLDYAATLQNTGCAFNSPANFRNLTRRIASDLA